MAVCTRHVTGGFGEQDRLRLLIAPETHGRVEGLDASGIAALGFDADEIARLNDSVPDHARLPGARRAWARLTQRGDSGRPWRAVAVGATRAAIEGDGLIVRARVGFGYETVDSVTLRVVPQLLGVEPSALYVNAAQASVIRPLRGGAERCDAAAPVTLGNGRRGSVWVRSMP